MKLTDITYDLMGEVHHKNQIEIYSELKKKSSKNITLYHNIKSNEIQNIVSTSKVYFHPSVETFGIAVVESICAGCNLLYLTILCTKKQYHFQNCVLMIKMKH